MWSQADHKKGSQVSQQATSFALSVSFKLNQKSILKNIFQYVSVMLWATPEMALRAVKVFACLASTVECFQICFSLRAEL